MAELYTFRDVEKLTGKSRNNLHRAAETGELPFKLTGDNQEKRFSSEDVGNFWKTSLRKHFRNAVKNNDRQGQVLAQEKLCMAKILCGDVTALEELRDGPTLSEHGFKMLTAILIPKYCWNDPELAELFDIAARHARQRLRNERLKSTSASGSLR